MKNLVFVAALFAVLSCTMAIDSINVCTINAGAGLFYLCPLTQIPASVAGNSKTGEVTFSLVDENVQRCDNSTGIDSIYGTFTTDLTCDVIAADKLPSYNLLNDTDPSQGLNITYPVVTSKDDLGITNFYRLIVELGCDVEGDDATKTEYTYTTKVDSNVTALTKNTTYIVKGKNQYGCPVFSFTKIINFVRSNQYVFAAVFGVIGLILTFFGLKFFNFAVFTIASILGTVITASLFFQLTSLGSAAWVLWAVFAVSLILGGVLGVLALKLEKVGFFCIGAALGVVGGLMLYNALILRFLSSDSGTAPLYITLVICAIIAGIIAFYVFESILIIATSLIGSYLIVRVISIFAGHYPNEAYVTENLKDFDPITYAYLAGILILAIIGMVFQFKRKASVEKEEDVAKNPANYAYYRY